MNFADIASQFSGAIKKEINPRTLVNYFIKCNRVIKHNPGVSNFSQEIGAAKILLRKHGGQKSFELIARSFMLTDPPNSLFLLTNDKYISMVEELVDDKTLREGNKIYPGLFEGLNYGNG